MERSKQDNSRSNQAGQFLLQMMVTWVFILLAAGELRGQESPDEGGSSGSINQQQGSWLHWWSYDGISGPDYWNINKRWRLCGSGRKQSPVDVRTDRLLYDHLLGPIRLTWLSSGANSESSTQESQQAAQEQAQRNDEQQLQRPVRVQLLNSGRGLEVWLEGLSGGGGDDESGAAEGLILSHGPLSYAYKLFKIELHTAANYAANRPLESALGTGHAQPASSATPPGGQVPKDGGGNEQEGADVDEAEDEDEEENGSVPEALRVAKSSEHQIDGQAFDGEVQLHFYNRRLASSAVYAQEQLAAAGDDSRPNLFAAVSVFVLVRSPGTTSSSSLKAHNESSALDFILDNLAAIPNQGDKLELQLTRRHLEALVPERRQYVAYEGSLARPPCAESVDWILVNRALWVDGAKFGGLFEKLNTQQENIRPIKSLHRRLLRTTISNLNERRQSGSSGSGGREPASDLCSSSNHLNCTSNGGRQQQDNLDNNLGTQAKWTAHSGREGAQQSERRRPATCSMRPNYAYQLRFGKPS